MYNYKNFEDIKTIGDFNEVSNIDKWTHFHWICDYNSSNLKVIKYCVEHGADFNIQNVYRNTQFHFIFRENTTKEVLEYCLENGADLTIKNKYEKTPFHFICKYHKSFIPICKPYINEYDFIKTLKELNWKEYV